MDEMIGKIWDAIKTFLEEPWLESLCLIIGGVWALFLFRSSNKHERDNNELLNQPKFKFFDAMNCHGEIKRSCDTQENDCRPMPDFCDNPECNKIHWFDIKNDGNFPAEGITLSLVLEGENNYRTKIATRRMGVKHLQAQESLQFSIASSSIPASLYEDKNVGDNFRFYVFLQYRSGYSKYWYKRIYQIDASKIARVNFPDCRSRNDYLEHVWARGIELFGMCEQDCRCEKDLPFRKKLESHIRSNNKKLSLQEYANYWVSDLFGATLAGRLYYRVVNLLGKLRRKKNRKP